MELESQVGSTRLDHLTWIEWKVQFWQDSHRDLLLKLVTCEQRREARYAIARREEFISCRDRKHKGIKSRFAGLT